MTSTGFNVPYTYIYRKYIDHIHPPLLSSFTLPLLLIPSPYQGLFYIFVLPWLSVCSVGFWPGILFINILYFNQCNSFYYSSLHFSSYSVLLNSFQCAHCVLFLQYISILFILYHSLLLFLLH
jgi:hypothetical protein